MFITVKQKSMRAADHRRCCCELCNRLGHPDSRGVAFLFGEGISMAAKLLVIDNYDSFTYNLVQMFRCYPLDVHVFRSDQIDLAQVRTFSPDYILISPGPKDPQHAGISMPLIEACYRQVRLRRNRLSHCARRNRCMAKPAAFTIPAKVFFEGWPLRSKGHATTHWSLSLIRTPCRVN